MEYKRGELKQVRKIYNTAGMCVSVFIHKPSKQKLEMVGKEFTIKDSDEDGQVKFIGMIKEEYNNSLSVSGHEGCVTIYGYSEYKYQHHG